MNEKTQPGSTIELWARLFSAPTVNNYLTNNGNAELPSLTDYIGELCRVKGETTETVSKRGGIERSYGHRLFSGSRNNPSRDVVLQLAFGLKLSCDEAQQLLKVARMSPLHPKVKRDAVIAHCLHNNIGIIEAQQLLYENALPLLGGLEK